MSTRTDAKIRPRELPGRAPSTGLTILTYTMGALIRYWLINSRYQTTIMNHIEVSTPLNAWKRVSEGLYLQKHGIDPYQGDLIHEAPLTMYVYERIVSYASEMHCLKLVFVVVDVLTSMLLYLVAERYLLQLFIQQEENKVNYAEDSENYLLTGRDFVKAPLFVAAAFLFNPYLIFNCVGMSTMVFHNFFITLFLLSMLHGFVGLCSVTLAIVSTMSLYPIILVIPTFLHFYNIVRDKIRATGSVVLFVTAFSVLNFISYNLAGHDLSFVKNVYGFILTVPSLQPNIGLFWYFFTEMFDHFRDLFICSFQINATILYLVPLSIKFRKDPFLLTAALLFVISVFKSYPCLGDVGFVLSLLPCFMHLFNYSQQGFLVSIMFLVTSALGPILWHLWIYSNSANANFYFGVTLAFAIAQIFLVTDILFAYLKREFCLYYGKDRTIDGKEAILILE